MRPGGLRAIRHAYRPCPSLLEPCPAGPPVPRGSRVTTSHGPLDWPTRDDDGHGTAAASRPKADRVGGRLDGFRRGGVADCASWDRTRSRVPGGAKHPHKRARTGLVQPRSDGGRSSKARSIARSSRMLNRFGGGLGSAKRRRWRTRRASAFSTLASSAAVSGGRPASSSRSAMMRASTRSTRGDRMRRLRSPNRSRAEY